MKNAKYRILKKIVIEISFIAGAVFGIVGLGFIVT